MKTPHIAYISADPGVPVFGRKGCSIHVQEVVRALLRRRTRVSLFAARYEGEPAADLKEAAMYSLPCPRGSELGLREQLCLEANQVLRRALDATGPYDLVYERYSLWSVSGMEYARANHIPGLLEVNAPLIEEQAAHRGLVDRARAEEIAARLFQEASALIAVSEAVGDYLRNRGARTEAVQVIPNGVNAERFPSDRAATWGWPGAKATFTVGFVGTLKPWHGVPVLIEAFGQLHRHCADARLLVVGDGPERGQLEARVKELGLEAVTHFTGSVAADEIPGVLAAMDVAVAPYPPLEKFYFSPLKVYEYMAAARAVIASRIGQLNDLIQHEENGLLFEPGDAADLTNQLIRLRQDPILRARLAAAGRQTVLRGHTWDQVAERILKVAESHRKPDAPNRTRLERTHDAR